MSLLLKADYFLNESMQTKSLRAAIAEHIQRSKSMNQRKDSSINHFIFSYLSWKRTCSPNLEKLAERMDGETIMSLLEYLSTRADAFTTLGKFLLKVCIIQH